MPVSPLLALPPLPVVEKPAPILDEIVSISGEISSQIDMILPQICAGGSDVSLQAADATDCVV